MTSKGWTYYPKRYNVWRESVSAVLPGLLTEAGLTAPLEGPLEVTTAFVCTRPKTTKLQHPKSDLDNLEKSCWDACNGLCWFDDYQIVESHSTKRWANPGEEGYIEIHIRTAA